jgi:alpha-beta hydrolase superfamily lysophospholipase
MIRKALRWVWAHRKRSALLFLLLLFVLLNVLAYVHARAMTHYAEAGDRTDRPEGLSFLGKVRVLCTGVTVPRPSGKGTPADRGLAFEGRHLDVADGTRLEAWHVPHPRARGLVLLFHGYASCKADLLPEIAAFHELGYATLAVDFRGSGGSSGDVTTIGVREADDVAAACAHARDKGLGSPVILFGKSMGAAAVLRAVSVHGLRPDALVLECPFDRLLSTVEARFEAMGVPAFPAARLLVFWGGVQHGFDGFAHNPAEYARAVRCPALFLHGEGDPRVSVAQVESVAAAVQGPRQTVIFSGLGHECYVSARPRPWRDAVSGFLATRLAPPGP